MWKNKLLKYKFRKQQKHCNGKLDLTKSFASKGSFMDTRKCLKIFIHPKFSANLFIFL